MRRDARLRWWLLAQHAPPAVNTSPLSSATLIVTRSVLVTSAIAPSVSPSGISADDATHKPPAASKGTS